jgi:hypothetical protein
MKARIEFKLADAWIGAFWKQSQGVLHIWVCIVPCFPLHMEIRRLDHA